MKEILFLCHRIPYPPNKGDKIRAFHMLSALAEHYKVHLGTFIDDPDDWQYCSTLGASSAETCYRPLSPGWARIRCLIGLSSGQPLSFAWYRDRKLQQWVNRLMHERPIEAVIVFSSTMAPYVEHYRGVRRVLDFVDVDSEKWRQYAATAAAPARWVFAREGRRLLAAERKLAASFDASVFVSSAEAELFHARAPECAGRTEAVPNGVDSAWFDPARHYPDPYAGSGQQSLVFTGAMDYRANIDAVVWFAHDVLPLIRHTCPGVSFFIVGARPAREVLDLERITGVEVTGTVADVRPWLAHAALAVAPLRVARGMQNKVLEALSMGKRVVLTPEAAAGLKPLSPEFAAIGSTPRDLSENVVQFLQAGGSDNPFESARNHVLAHYSWGHQLKRFLALVAGEDTPCAERQHAQTALAQEASA